MKNPSRRLALIVSHPIQYYVPLYRCLASRRDLEIKVFFTWHAGGAPVADHGFRTSFAWDIPMTCGYDFEVVNNTSPDPGTHRFLGLRNPTLVQRVIAWRPDLAIIHGWAWLSHLRALYAFGMLNIPTLLRGDSHLLDESLVGPRWLAKKALLTRIFSWPAGFLTVGSANRAYYRAFGVEPMRLHYCPHSIDVGRFAEPAGALEREAAEWRRRLGIDDQDIVLLYAGKFEPKKCPVRLMHSVLKLQNPRVVLVIVGGGELQGEINALAAVDPARFRVLSFQNQSRMPVVYRVGDLFVLPSSHGETWGLAVNEALACGRPVLVSDRVGCAPDVVDPSCGQVFSWAKPRSLEDAITEMTADRRGLAVMGEAASERAWSFDVTRTEEMLIGAIERVCAA